MEVAKRQGDVIIVFDKELPKGAKKLNTDIVIEGEETGHKHRVVGDVALYALDELLYVEVTGPAKIVHDTHGTLELPIGVYEIQYPQGYDYINEEKRRVKD